MGFIKKWDKMLNIVGVSIISIINIFEIMMVFLLIVLDKSFKLDGKYVFIVIFINLIIVKNINIILFLYFILKENLFGIFNFDIIFLFFNVI